MGFFGSIFKAVARGVKSVGGKAFRGLKSAGESAVRGVKSGVKSAVNQIKKGVQKLKETFGKSKPKKTWKEGDVPTGFVNLPGQGKMAYKGGKPVTGKIIRDSGMRRPRMKGEGSNTFKYIDNLTDPESILL